MKIDIIVPKGDAELVDVEALRDIVPNFEFDQVCAFEADDIDAIGDMFDALGMCKVAVKEDGLVVLACCES